jgi:hypothetical protein
MGSLGDSTPGKQPGHSVTFNSGVMPWSKIASGAGSSRGFLNYLSQLRSQPDYFSGNADK